MKLKLSWIGESVVREFDPNVGAIVSQLTGAKRPSHNIYCEERYTSADGSLVAFLRLGDDRASTELRLCDLRTRKVALVCDQVKLRPATTRRGENFYFVRGEGDARVLFRLDLKSLELEEVMDLGFCPAWLSPMSAVSPDERYYVAGMTFRDGVFALHRVDLRRGGCEVFHEQRDICNPHLHYEPAEGRDILIQQNRGCCPDSEGRATRAYGEEGVTLYLADAEGKNVRPLPVGRPWTGTVTGHECWVGLTGRIILTTLPAAEDAVGQEVRLLAPGDRESRCLARGLIFNHISASEDGRFFVVDDSRNQRLYIGGVESGRLLPFCESRTSRGHGQPGHTHPYITPDNRHVIFNSAFTGEPQVWAAEIPEGFLETLL